MRAGSWVAPVAPLPAPPPSTRTQRRAARSAPFLSAAACRIGQSRRVAHGGRSVRAAGVMSATVPRRRRTRATRVLAASESLGHRGVPYLATDPMATRRHDACHRLRQTTARGSVLNRLSCSREESAVLTGGNRGSSWNVCTRFRVRRAGRSDDESIRSWLRAFFIGAGASWDAPLDPTCSLVTPV